MRAALCFCVLAGALLVAPAALSLSPNDPGWSEQWAERKMRVDKVWDTTVGSPDVVIAAVDTGVEADRNDHLVDLEGALAPGWDFTDGDDVIDDDHGHGTLAASIMVARGNNSWGIAGICWRCRLMPVRVSKDGLASDEQVALGMRWAVDHGARIVSVGLVREKGGTPDPILQSAVEYAVAKGAFVVTPAGNNGNDTLTWPGAYPGVVATAASDPTDTLYEWSSRGPWVQLAAPGCHALVSMLGTWGWHCGTSFTGPEVAGIAALALSLKPELSASAIAEALRATAAPVPGNGGGRVDAYAALQRLGAITPPPPPPPGAQMRTVVRTGKVRRLARLRLDVGDGALRLNLTTKPRDRCELTVNAGADILLGERRASGAVLLSSSVSAGRYTAEIRCRKLAKKTYRLSVSAVQTTAR